MLVELLVVFYFNSTLSHLPHLKYIRLRHNEVFCRFSPPEQLHSDQGRHLNWSSYKSCVNISRYARHTRFHHSQCNGVVEHFNRTLLDMLSTTMGNHPSDWDQSIRKLCLAYNSIVHSSTGFTPFFLCLDGKSNCQLI